MPEPIYNLFHCAVYTDAISWATGRPAHENSAPAWPGI